MMILSGDAPRGWLLRALLIVVVAALAMAPFLFPGAKPLNGAVFVVLNEGVTVAQFIKDNFANADVFTGAKSDSSGQFTLPDALKRNTDYSFVVAAKGYKAVEVDGFNIDNTQPDPLVLDVKLAK